MIFTFRAKKSVMAIDRFLIFPPVRRQAATVHARYCSGKGSKGSKGCSVGRAGRAAREAAVTIFFAECYGWF